MTTAFTSRVRNIPIEGAEPRSLQLEPQRRCEHLPLPPADHIQVSDQRPPTIRRAHASLEPREQVFDRREVLGNDGMQRPAAWRQGVAVSRRHGRIR